MDLGMFKPTELVGVPFKYGGRGPDYYDCYGLIMELYRRCRSVELPDLRTPDSPSSIPPVFAMGMTLWAPAERVEGNVVAFRMGAYISHCGYLLDAGRMIHTLEATGGVTIEPLEIWERKIYGVYDYVGPRN